jgi:Uma2 family endonuclease
MSSQPIRHLPEPLPRPAEQAAACCTILLPKTEIRLPASAFTLAGFRAWAKSEDAPEKARLTFIDQQILIDMSGEELQAHVLVKAAVYAALLPLNAERRLGMFFPDGALVTNERANVSNIPDAVLATWASLQADRIRLVADEKRPDRYLELEGTPDWVLEIASDSSVHKDTQLLREAYHRAGIPEYWLIDARGQEIDFRILLYRPASYVVAPRRGGWQRSEVFGCRFRLERRRGPLGFWEFTLQVKPLR